MTQTTSPKFVTPFAAAKQYTRRPQTKREQHRPNQESMIFKEVQSTHAGHSAPRRRSWRRCKPQAVVSSLGTKGTTLGALVKSTNHHPPVCPWKCLTSEPSHNFRGRLASSNPLRESNRSEAGDGLGPLRPVAASGLAPGCGFLRARKRLEF